MASRVTEEKIICYVVSAPRKAEAVLQHLKQLNSQLAIDNEVLRMPPQFHQNRISPLAPLVSPPPCLPTLALHFTSFRFFSDFLDQQQEIMGRRKVQLKRIENKINRQVTFSKRRSGLLKKSHEISVLCDAEVAVIIFSTKGKLYEYSTGSCMEKILNRYERYRLAEKALVHSDHESQGDWHQEYAKLKAKVEALHKSQRQFMGEQLDSLTNKELQQLENQLECSLKHVRSRKTQVMFDSIAELQRTRKSLEEQNKILRKEIMEKQQGKTLAHQQVHPQTSTYLLPSILIPETSPTPVTGSNQEKGGTVGDEAAAQIQLQNSSYLLPPWMICYSNGQLN